MQLSRPSFVLPSSMQFCIWSYVWQILQIAILCHSVTQINLPSKSTDRLFSALWIQNSDLWRQTVATSLFPLFPNVTDLELLIWVLDHIFLKGCESMTSKLKEVHWTTMCIGWDRKLEEKVCFSLSQSNRMSFSGSQKTMVQSKWKSRSMPL